MDAPEEIERLNQELLELGQERKSDLLIGTALDGLSDACFASNRYKEGINFALEATPYLERAEHLYELLQNKIHSGVLIYMSGNFPEAREALYKVLEQMPENDEPNFVNLNSNLHYQIGILEVLMGYPVEGLEYLHQAVQDRKKRPIVTEVMSIYAAMGLAYYIKGEFRTGYEWCNKAVEIGEQMEYWRMLGYAYAYGGLSAHNLGYLDVAWEYADKALDIGQTYSHGEISSIAYRIMGNTYLRLEDYHSAIEYFQRGIRIAGEHYVALELSMLLGYALASVGQVEEGLKYLIDAYQTAAQLQLGSISVYARSLLLTTQSRNNDNNDRLLEKIEIALVDAKCRSINKAATMLKMPFVRANRRSGDFIRMMNESLQDASRMPDPLLEASILRDLFIFEKNRNLARQVEEDRLKVILKELAPHAEGMPFESAWKKYFDSMQALFKT